MFTTLIVQPIFNLLVLIYAILPGHNFGLALIIFTVVIRLLLWPLVRKQLHSAKAMRKLQPELKRIKKEAAGDRQKETAMTMELYKERGINPFSTIPLLIPQFIILIGLYSGLQKVVHNPHSLVSFAYPRLQHLSWMKHLAGNIHAFDNTLFGIVDLTRAATGPKGLYLPALVIVAASAAIQYYQSKQLMPDTGDARKLRDILKSAGEGQQADQSEMNAAIGRSMRFFLPVMIFIFTVHIASALSLYWFIGGLVAYIQQAIVLKDDGQEMRQLANQPTTKSVAAIPEAEVVAPLAAPKKKKHNKSGKTAKRRK